MKPNIKVSIFIFLTLVGVFIVPAMLIVLHQYLYAIIAIGSFIASLYIFCYGMYEEYIGEFTRKYLEEQEVFHRFNGDQQKMRFYRAFKMYFDGDLTTEGLKKWLMSHLK